MKNITFLQWIFYNRVLSSIKCNQIISKISLLKSKHYSKLCQTCWTLRKYIESFTSLNIPTGKWQNTINSSIAWKTSNFMEYSDYFQTTWDRIVGKFTIMSCFENRRNIDQFAGKRTCCTIAGEFVTMVFLWLFHWSWLRCDFKNCLFCRSSY